MRKNSPRFNIASSFTINFLLTMNPCRFTNIDTDMLSRRLWSIAAYRRFYTVGDALRWFCAQCQWIILIHAIVYEIIDCCICRHSSYILSLIACPRCYSWPIRSVERQSMIMNEPLRKKVVKVSLCSRYL